MTAATRMDGAAKLDRRGFLAAAGMAAAAVAAPMVWLPRKSQAAAPYTAMALPYGDDALIPVISPTTIGFHYGKHHQGYVRRLNGQVAERLELAALPLAEVVGKAAADPADVAVFNNAAQAWNHDFYWSSLRPGGGGTPPQALRERLEADFGGIKAFTDALKEVSVKQFASGWGWLVEDGGKLRVVSTGNADTPLVHGQKPLLTIDVWEHAYYLDYQNRRAAYVDAVVDKLLNWEFAAENLAR